MEIIDITSNRKYLEEYVRLCSITWGDKKTDKELEKYVIDKTNSLLNKNNDKVIIILGLVDNDILLGFISLFKYDGDERLDLTPWYATMYVKEEYRNRHLSNILNDAILKKAKDLGYSKIYLKSYLENYYEKFNAKYMETLNNGEKLFYIEL